MSAFTPGPWKVYRTSDGERIIGIGCAENGEGITDPRFGLWGSGPEREANARLIAAAPDLLAALQAALPLLEELEQDDNTYYAEAVNARVAIAKATGATP